MSNKKAMASYLAFSEAMGDDEIPNPINNPEILIQDVTGLGCPEVHEGTLLGGQSFFFRYRHGTASLGVGWNPEAAMMASSLNGDAAYLEVGDPIQGVFFDDRDRDDTFATLLAQVYH